MACTEPLGGAHAARLPARCRKAANPSAPCGRPRSTTRRTYRAPRSRCLPTCHHGARPRGPAVQHWCDRRARAWPSPAQTCPSPNRRCVAEPGPDGRVVAAVVPKGSLDAPAQEGCDGQLGLAKQTHGSARRRRHCCRCAGSAIPQACGRPDPISRPAPGWRPPASACAPAR